MTNPNIIILHLEGEPGDIGRVDELLLASGPDFKKYNAVSELEFLYLLNSKMPDVILADWRVPTITALEVLAILKARMLLIPVILLVAPHLEYCAVGALKDGFADYLTKDRMQRLPFAICNAIERVKLARERYRSFSSGLTTELLLTKTEKMAKIGTLEINLLTNGRSWSPGVDAILGYEDGGLEQSFESFTNCVHPDDVERVRREVAHAITHSDKIDISFRIITPDGALKYIHSKLLFQANESGRYYRANGFIRDITEGKLAEMELQQANRELNSLFQTIDEVFFTRDMVQSKLIQISPACHKLYGYTQAEFYAYPDLWLQIMHTEDARLQQAQYEKFKAGQTVLIQYRVIHKTNGIRWAESKIIPSLDENGNLVRLDGVTRDITERKQLELTQQQSEQRLRELIENSSDILTVSGVNGEIIFTSENIQAILGYGREEYNKIVWSKSFIHPSDWQRRQSLFREIINNPGRVFPFSYRVRHASGKWIWVEGTIKNLLHLPMVNGIVANYRDISQRREAERLVEENRSMMQSWLLKRSSILNALPSQIALLDGEGKIVDVNESWRRFGMENGLLLSDFGIGANYITVADTARGAGATEGHAVAEGIKQVISGEKPNFVMEYTCHSPVDKAWYQIVVSPLTETGSKGAVVLHHNITERKVAEDKLAASEQQYRNMVETAQEGIWVLDENLVTIFVNKKVCDMMGYTADEMLGKHNYDFKDESQKLATLARIAKRRRGIVETHESVFTTKSGRNIICTVATNGIFGPDGGYVGTLAMVTDITERRMQEDALKQSEANLSAIIENTTDLVYSLDKDLRFITYNQRFETIMQEVYGFEVSHGISSSVMLSKVPSKTAKKWKVIYKKALAGQTLNFVSEYPHGSGSVYLNYSVNPIWRSDEVIGLSVFSRDITQQRQNEVNLIRSEANLRSIFETTQLSTVLFNADLEIVSFNKNARQKAFKYFGKKLKAGNSGFNYFEPARWPLIRQILERVKRREVVNYEAIYDFKDGSKDWFEVKWSGVFNAKKEMVGIILTLNIITEKKMAELERERITADLMRRNQDLEQFTYIISHNLRVPVANIKGLSQILAFEESLDAEFIKTLGALSNSVNQLDNVIVDLNQILEVNKQVNEKREAIVFFRIVEDITIELQLMLEGNEATINCDFEEAEQLFSIKPYIYSIFQNLIVNSIKYRRENLDPVINIRAFTRADKVCITIEDNGRGIDMERFGSQIFGLYKRFDFSAEGKGMGLYMVRKQVENLGGAISVESGLGQGAKFTIELPVA